ncbi:hypothetical protein XENOCAPTIV_000428 [Xenoophorus captivus]|uniref:Uncharacterized protein n=1 Tax=Xenoophorus captivus TaxID=1517983 RepID=A0ABV0QZ61_9TELE
MAAVVLSHRGQPYCALCFPLCSLSVVNGLQPLRHENGLVSKGDAAHFEDFIHLTNQDNTANGARDNSETSTSEPILTFESEESFMKKTGPMKPPHVAGTQLGNILQQTQTELKLYPKVGLN